MVLIRGTRCSELCSSVMGPEELDALNESRAKNILCDAVLRTEDGGAFPVQRTVLLRHSDFFRALFTTWLHDREQTDFLLRGIKPDVLTQILDYAYTGQVDINPCNAYDLLVASDYLSVLCLREVCCNFIKDTMDVNTCVREMLFARSYLITELEFAARHFVLRHFVQVSQCNKQLLELPVEELVAILGDEQVNVSNEEDVWHCALRWIDRDTENRKVHILDLMETVRLGRLDKNVFLKEVKDHPYVKENASCRTTVEKILKFFDDVHIMWKTGKDILTPEFAQPRIPHDILFVIEGSRCKDLTACVEVYDVRADLWIMLQGVNSLLHRDNHGTAVVGFNIFIIGGTRNCMCLRSCHCVNVVTKTWREVSPMSTARCRVSVVGLGETVYAIGGDDGRHYLKTAERYDCRTNRWSSIAPMKLKRADASATELSGKIYVVGGENDVIQRNSAEMYDPEFNQWTLISRMRSARCRHSVVAFDGCVYAIGGERRGIAMYSGEKYDPRTDNWIEIPRMRSARRSFATAVTDDKIFAIGGVYGHTRTSRVEYFDKRTNQWYEATAMNCARAGLTACVVKGLPNARDYAYKNRDMFLEEKRRRERANPEENNYTEPCCIL